MYWYYQNFSPNILNKKNTYLIFIIFKLFFKKNKKKIEKEIPLL